MAQPADAGKATNQDLSSKIKAVSSILPIVGNNTTEGTGVGVDLKGYESATMIVHVGDSGDTLSGSVTIQLSFEESDSSGSGYTTIPATNYRVDVGDIAIIDAPGEDSKVIQAAVWGTKRYIRPLLTFVGTHTNGTPISAAVIKGHPRVLPATM